MTSGIYKIENKKTGQIYIGQSKNIEKRFKRHCYVSPIDLDIAKYGKENFNFDILEEADENLEEREAFWIEGYGAYENEYHYNLSPKGTNLKENRRSFDKYILWDVSICYYNKVAMFNNGNDMGMRPRKCFRCNYKGYRLPIGNFYDFISCEIIGNLVHSFIND